MLNLSFHEYCKMSKNNERTESYFKICYKRMYHASHIEHGIDIAVILRCAVILQRSPISAMPKLEEACGCIYSDCALGNFSV